MTLATLVVVTASDDQLRPALELSFAVAVAGTRLRPPIVPPSALRPFLKFQKLPGSALTVVRRVVDDDEAFRKRAAGVATEELAGPIGVLWLQRPDGWEAAVDELLAKEAAESSDGAADRTPKGRAERRREAAEHAATKAQAELAALRAELEREKEQRHAADQQAATIAGELAELRAERDALWAELRSLRSRSRAAVEGATAMSEERDALLGQVAELHTLLDDALAGRATAEGQLELLRDAPPQPSFADPSLLKAADGLQDVASALRQLAGSLEGTGRALVDSPQPVRPTPQVRPTRRSRRTPLAIPGGLFGDSVAAANHLLRQPGVTLVVDGYNIAKTGWPALSLEQQRESLLDLLEDQVRRTGLRAVVIFDGAAVPATQSRRRLVRVRFSAPDVIADDDIRELVGDLPAEAGVIVATNDQAVVRDVRASGANVISAEQLLEVLRSCC